MRSAHLLVLALTLLAMAPLAASALSTEVRSVGGRLGIMVLSPGDYETVHLKPGEPLVFQAAIPADVKVEQATLFLCGKTYPMTPVESWGGGTVIYEARILLPPVDDLYSWKIRVKTSNGFVETCTHKTMVVFSGAQGQLAGEGKRVLNATDSGDSCPIELQPASDKAGGGSTPEAATSTLNTQSTSQIELKAQEDEWSTIVAAAGLGAVIAAAAALAFRGKAPGGGG